MIPLIITETETDKIDEATNGLQFSNFFFLSKLLFYSVEYYQFLCHILLLQLMQLLF